MMAQFLLARSTNADGHRCVHAGKMLARPLAQPMPRPRLRKQQNIYA